MSCIGSLVTVVISLFALVRQSVHFVADHWTNYKAMKERAGDTPTMLPMSEDLVCFG